ncbi:MAG: PD-(D/E)XK nuclease family protein, partial [Hyphomicrobiaceae bacterium]
DLSGGRRRGRALARLWQEDWDGARQLVTDLRTAFEPLSELFAQPSKVALPAITAAHIAVSEALSALPDEQTTGEQLWRDEAGEAGAQLFSGLLDPDLLAPELMAADYPEFYRTLAREVAVRPHIPTHPRIFIWGPFESRLLQPDIVILGSLNEGTWPEAADPGPWLNRTMRKDLGLPAPEQQIGYAAHDFSQLLGAETVYLTRSEMIEGDPTVPSRWLLRLDAVLARLGLSDCLEPEQPWLAWAQDRDRIDAPHRISRPEPRPPLEFRPRRLSVSSIETWIANPYALFAERILKLDALAPLGGEPAARLRGSVVHEALGRFAQKFPVELPDDPTRAMLAIAHEVFAALRAHPRVAAFWLPRFQRFASWFGQMEPELRQNIEWTLAEVAGSTVLEAPGGPFTLTARADRIDVGDGRITITDYKTGANLSNLAARAKTGRAPQLLLEALIAREVGFAEVQPLSVTGLRYISASGGEPPGAVVEVAFDDVSARIEQTAQELQALIALFDDETTPYPATRRPQFQYDYDSYAHLARISEWAGEASEETE